MPSPYEAPDLWQRLTWGPATFPPDTVPGHCTITKLTQKIKKSTPKTPGKNGQQSTTLGLENAQGTAEVVFANGASNSGASYYDLVMEEWNKVYPPKAPAQCSHGAFGPTGMTDGQITSFDGLKWEGGKGILTFSFDGWVAPKVLASGSGCACAGLSDADKAQIAALEAYISQITPSANDPTSPFAQVQKTEITAIQAQIAQIKAKGGCSCVKKADKADPGKQWKSKYLNSASGQITPGTPGNVTPNGTPTQGQGIPLGEIQPPEIPAP